ncbi:MAG: hypothetical protein ABW164_06960 [Sphingobium sp.]
MQRLYFDIHNGTGLTEDHEGQAMPIEEARAFAIRSIRSILSDEVLHGMLDVTGRIEIRTGSGESMGRVKFDEAIEMRLR